MSVAATRSDAVLLALYCRPMALDLTDGRARLVCPHGDAIDIGLLTPNEVRDITGLRRVTHGEHGMVVSH